MKFILVFNILLFSSNSFASKNTVQYCSHHLSVVAATELGSILTEKERKKVRQYGIPTMSGNNQIFKVQFQVSEDIYWVEILLDTIKSTCWDINSIMVSSS